ncbi:hypothetical protein MSG28_003557 [Choristoneura fumiferana]|uniref:Uncharacterized protein n=1 Tax=Choristoneura fumiferana TaxID=7141 RepID=A0ACC0KG38_CHOFU|nr:hypothetical protein MSG28_003557 [Choristoneura fumiferana]
MPNARQDLLPDGCRRVAAGIMIMSSEEFASFLRVNTSHLKDKTMFYPKIPKAVAEATRLWSGYLALDTLRTLQKRSKFADLLFLRATEREHASSNREELQDKMATRNYHNAPFEDMWRILMLKVGISASHSLVDVFNQRRSQQTLAEGDNCRHRTKKGKKEFFAQKGNNKKKNDRKGTAAEVERLAKECHKGVHSDHLRGKQKHAPLQFLTEPSKAKSGFVHLLADPKVWSRGRELRARSMRFIALSAECARHRGNPQSKNARTPRTKGLNTEWDKIVFGA